MAKTLIWTITVLGLTPSALVAGYGVLLLCISRRWGSRYSGQTYVHDSYFSLGDYQISITPQYWSLMVLIAGIVMVIAALFAILRPSAT